MHRADVIVVGAGIAGLAAAKKLIDAGLHVVVLEARDRVGGRACTNRSTFGETVDHGASFLHNPDLNPLTPIVRRYGFTEVDAYSRVHHFDGRDTRPADCSDARCRAYERVMGAIDHAARRGADVPVSTIVTANDRYEQLVLDEIGPCTAGVDIEGVSTMDVATKVREVYDGCGGGRADVMVAEGLGTFVEAFGAGVRVELGAIVQRIRWSGAGVEVASTRGDFAARSLVMTAPTGVLARGAIAFDPVLPSWKLGAFRDLPMASFKKIYLELAPEAFARMPPGTCVEDLSDSRMSFILGPGGSERLVLAMTGGALAARLDARGEDWTIRYVLARLRRFLGRDVDGKLVRGWVSRWQRDAWTGGGAYSAVRPGRYAARKLAQIPLDATLYFAGEAYDDKWASYLPGAYRTGVGAAGRVLSEAFGGAQERLHAA